MNKIEVRLLDAVPIERLVQTACMITRGANKFATINDLLADIDAHPWSTDKVLQTLSLPHSKLSRFINFTFLITGSSRRFLAQLTTHHIGISIISGSLQYSDWSKHSLDDKFVVPYNLLDKPELKDTYLKHEESDMQLYNTIATSCDNDTAGYCSPESLRNVLLVTVNLEELRFIGNQRLCLRNTDETKYIIAKMISTVVHQYSLPSTIFMPNCIVANCKEGKYSCGKPISKDMSIDAYIATYFPNLY